MPVIDEHVEQVSVEGYVFTVEPRRKHCCVFYEITHGAGEV